MTRILNQTQAAAVYAAMVYLQGVSGKLHARLRAENGETIHVKESGSGDIQVYRGDAIGNPTGVVEQYEGQLVFAHLHKVL